MSPISTLFTSLLSLSPRAIKPYVVFSAEENAMCRTYADSQSDVAYGFAANDKVNVTCWTTTSMPGDPKGLAQGMDTGSYIWAWASIPDSYALGFSAKHWGVENTDTGGKAKGKGCWIHEDHLKNGNSIDLPKQVQSCGTASRHQVGLLKSQTAPFQCRNCTDLSQSLCQTTYNTTSYGWVDIGCWAKGTKTSLLPTDGMDYQRGSAPDASADDEGENIKRCTPWSSKKFGSVVKRMELFLNCRRSCDLLHWKCNAPKSERVMSAMFGYIPLKPTPSY
ncbi:hypothetical protein K505DRAFT_420092 [Melanomma pulvis-pyrius CBS 109.77]|uniref:Uncharacterized protein n=1 Tax=Melanomma pulvis-pyrius CBS 109.77 TaxID=1314802 RepID=A0A6A6X134_9PLEO|nr:hypothetical protein K505DRAFT_420092 [Melanomma pulvis-pyrius CBS 109.77]